MAEEARIEDQLVSESTESETYRREVALEGLEGITLASLWIRLQEAFLHYNKEARDANDATFQQAVWEQVLADPELSFYILPEPRPSIPPLECKRVEDFTYFDVPETTNILSVSKRPFSAVDSEEEELDITTKANTSDPSGYEVGHFTYSWEAKEIEPSLLNSYGIFLEKQPEVFGSCRHLRTREDVSISLRKSKPSLQIAREQFADRLVIVASEQVRKDELGLGKLSPTDLKKVSHHTYAVLEVIARHRHYGQFLVLGGWTMLGRGHQAAKQLHNCTKRLKHLGIITKKTCRFDIPTSHGAYQYLSYTLLTAFDRPISTRSQSWVLQVRKLIFESPPPGYPAILLPRLEAYQHDPFEKSIRKRVRRLFMDLRSETVEKSDLIGTFPQLKIEDRSQIMVFYVDPEAEENRVEPVKSEPYAVPADLKIDQNSPKRQLSLAIMSMLKANRDRGLSGPEINAVAVQQGSRKKLAEKALKQCLSLGYVIRSGHFNTRNKPRRYVLVSSEEERQQVLARLAKDDNNEEISDEPPSDKSIESTSHIIHDSSLQALKRKLLQIAEKMQCFPDGNYFFRLARFFDSTIQTVPSVEFHAWLQEEIDKGFLALEIIVPNNPGFQQVVDGMESVEEQSVLIVHSSADREAIVRNYAKRLNFENVLRSVLGPYKEIKGVLELCRVEPGKFSCHDIFIRDRITRIRLLHRYLIQLAHHKSDTNPVNQRPQWAYKVERFEFCDHYPGWVTMEEIVRQMPLAVFVRLVPLLMPEDEDKKYIFSSVEDPDIAFLPLYMQDLRMLLHTMESRHFIYVLRDLLGLLQCFGFVREGPSDALYPDGTELFYIADHIVVPDTSSTPLSQISNGMLKEEAFSGLVDRKFEFHSDKNVMEFWQAVQKHALTMDWSRKSEADAMTLDKMRVDELKERFGRAVMLAYPDEIPSVFHPPGDRRSIYGFDSVLNLNDRKQWKRRMLIAFKLRSLPAYVPDLDDVAQAQASVSLYRGAPIPAASLSRLKIVTGGKRVKPGPKHIKKPVNRSPLRGGAAEIHRLFQPYNWGSLFHNVRPWCRGEELVAVVYLAIRDLIVRFKRKPIHIDILVELLENYFPDAPFRRSAMECDVLLHRMGRLPKILHEIRIVQNMARRMVDLEGFLDFVNQNKKFPLSVRELWEAWQGMVEQVLNKIIQAPPFPRRMLLNTKADIRSVVNSSEAAKQFALENLVMQALHTESTIDPTMVEVLGKQSDRTMVGMATYLSYRGILAHRKGISNKQTPHLLITVGTKGMGLSMKFNEKYRSTLDTLVAVCISPSTCAGLGEGGIGQKTMIPVYFQPIMEHFARNCQYDRTQLNNVFQLTELGSNFWARAHSAQTVVEEDHYPDLKYRPRYRVEGADVALQQTIQQMRLDIDRHFSIWKSEQEREMILPKTEQELHAILKENFSGNDFRLAGLVLKELKERSHSGLTKKDLFQLMDVKYESAITDVHLLLNRLVKMNCAVEGGCDAVSYVSALHAAPWVQETLTSSRAGVFLPRPWSKLDGGVEEEILVTYLRWILQFICEQHFTNLGSVITQFQPYLLGRTVMELIKVLHALALIKKSRRLSNPSLRYFDINPDNQWIDDDSLDDIFVGCHTSAFDSLMGIAVLEERFGLRREVVFADVAEAEDMDIDDDTDVMDDYTAQSDEPGFSGHLDETLDEEPTSQESMNTSVEDDDESSSDGFSDDETDDVNDDRAAFMDSIGLPGSRLLLGEGDDLDSSFLDEDSDADEVGVGTGKMEAEDMEED